MKKSISGQLALLMVICLFCVPVSQAAGAGSAQPSTSPAAETPVVVARIGPYTVTKKELEDRFMSELRPDEYEDYNEQAEPPTVKGALEDMLAEKAMVIEARAQGGLDERNRTVAKRYRDRKLASLLAQTYLEGKVTVSDSEIEQKMKADPNMDKVRAKSMVEREKMMKVWEQYYSQICERLKVKKLSENYPAAAEAHHRLLYRPRKARNVGFIRNYQVEEDLTPEEKKTVLATYESGQITIEDWLNAYCDIVPPRRPRDMKDTKVVEELLDAAMRLPLLVVEAEWLGLDKNKELLDQVRDYEDGMLLSQAKTAQYKEIKEPTAEEIRAYFDKNKEKFASSPSVKIDPIWCDDLAAARKVKAELDEGKDFEQAKQEHSLEKQIKAYSTYASNEGLFWDDISAGEPNDIVGPIKGFYRQGVKWRIVKILEKNAGAPREYEAGLDSQIKGRIATERRNAALAAYVNELMKKYTYQIYVDRIKDINPLDIP